MAVPPPLQSGVNIFRDPVLRETVNALIAEVASLGEAGRADTSEQGELLRTLAVRLTARGSTEGYFQFQEVYYNPSSGNWTDVSGGLTHTQLGECYCTGGAATAGMGGVFVGSVVYLRNRGMVDANGVAIFEFDPAPAVIPVDVTQVSGSDGTDSTAATWTYDVYAEDGDKILSAVSPQNKRPDTGKVKVGTQGYAHYELVGGTPTLTLGLINEIPNPFDGGSPPPPYVPGTPTPPYVPGGCATDDILIFDGTKWICHTPTTQTVLTGVSWNATTGQLEFTRETLTIIDKAGGVADTDIQFYDCDGNTP